MSHPRYASVLGLGFGDCGKGLFTDFLCRHRQADTVVRFNGGAQAGHNVVLPDGRQHTFAQFGAASFQAGVCTLLAQPFVIHPTALLVEAEFLNRLGVNDAIPRLLIDGRCRVNTPFHQAAGRLRELLRQDQAHGSCGIGFGETVAHALEHPDEALHYADLNRPAHAHAKLESMRQRLLNQFQPAMQADSEQVRTELAVLQDAGISAAWLVRCQPLLKAAQPASADQIARHMQHARGAIFEGAQGILLDEDYGFHPHTTWSRPRTTSINALMDEWGITEPVQHFGVLRSYLTRHGNGPLPTHSSALNGLAEPHNADAGWQGVFRRGQPDGVLLDYALRHVGALDGLLLSHLDIFQHGDGLQWCHAYDTTQGRIKRLPAARPDHLAAQAALTHLLNEARPVYEPGLLREANSLCERIEAHSGLKIAFGAYGNTHRHVHAAGIPGDQPA